MLSGGEKSVLPAGHLSTCTLFLRSNCFDSCSILFLALSFSDLLKEDVVWMAAYFAQYIKSVSVLMIPFQRHELQFP